MDHGDLDKDGDEDIVLVNVAKGKASLEIYKNRGYSAFMLQDAIKLVETTATSVKIADVDSDGDRDIILTNY